MQPAKAVAGTPKIPGFLRRMELIEGTAIAVLDIGWMHDGVQQQAYRVDKDVALLTFDLLTRIVARRIDAGPPFSAPFTL